MRFGVFMAPFHASPVKSPVAALARDIETIKLLDRLGYDEAWIGEHHSCGVELIASPEIFIAHVAAQTDTIKLGTGVLSLPYHNPLWVADRAILLDHLTRGRFMLGLGPGSLPTDASMIGLDPLSQRGALEEDTDVLMQLLNGAEPVTVKTDRYQLRDALCQLRPFTQGGLEVGVAAIASPSGPRIAGKHGLSLLSIGATLTGDLDLLAQHWDVAEERAAQFGTAMNRDGWRLVGPMHLAETKEQAYAEVEHGLDDWCDYLQHVAAVPHFEPGGATFTERVDWINASGIGVIGTPEDAIRQIGALEAQSKGGFGSYLMMAHEWATPAATARHYELFAEAVAPHFQQRLDRLAATEAHAKKLRAELHSRQGQALEEAKARHDAEKSAHSA
ncbi:LLM class flavin-dependent oxidoreductase [Amycolatopsis rhabdoformis]|uniref:LLM class flavin-dependent oxidoreductase n=1 Tax=Amycolatopsis rhabdoformis TaxID=1448059 RepID=A0ABZ1ICB1_9PSEU|nr:LLM class flavin-dependent oxidoreductase [Amycolatopsis rhabdoformis]WSE32052.1 LLM class flavin-dependent oxidoreductase [Amycolatopsis rhabdoformis]